MSEPYTVAGTLMWVRGDGDGAVHRCTRCRALTDDRVGHTASHEREDVALAKAIDALRLQITPGAFRPSKVAEWRESASVQQVEPWP